MADKRQNNRRNRNNQDDDFNPKFRKIRKKVCTLCSDKNFELDYKNGARGSNHFFVIIDEEQAIDFNYFGFLLSSNINKVSFPYNRLLEKNSQNGLLKDSIVKCDDFIKIENHQIAFKIGSVTEDDLISFLNIYEKFLINKNKKN